MKNRESKQLKLFIAQMLFMLFSVIQIQAETQTAAPAAPAWGLDPVTGTLLRPGIAVHTLGTLEVEKVAGDGDHSLKLFDTRTPNRADDRPINDAVDVYIHHNWDVGSIGNVFGIAIDKERYIYTTASIHFSSYFGYTGNNEAKITFGSVGAGVAADTKDSDNNPGELNDLQAAGAVYKIDKITGDVSLLASLPQTTHDFNQQSCENDRPISRSTGASLGNIAYDPIHDQLFVSNFDDGKIYRLAMDGTVLSTFQPAGFSGLVPSDTTTTGKAPYGLAVNLDGTKLYFGTNEINKKPQLFAVVLSPSGDFSGSEIDQHAKLIDDLQYTQNIGGQYVDDGANGNVWASYSDLKFTPEGELMIGLRTGCRSHLATSHNHGGAYYLLKQDANGLYNTPSDKVPGNGTSYTGTPEGDGTNDDTIRAGKGRYDAGSLPIYSLRTDSGDTGTNGVGGLGTGPDDGYGGIGIYDKGDGTYDYLVTSSDISQETGPHGFMSFPENFTLDTSAENIISPMAAYPSLQSSDTSADDRDYKGIGGDIEVLSVLMDWGDAPDTYSTNLYTGDSASGTDTRGPSHIITADGIYMGQSVDDEFDGVPSIGADGDDNASSPDDEDGISAFPSLLPGATTYTIPAANISAANSSGGDVTIHAWIDFDGNGVFDADEYSSVTVADGATTPSSDLVWSGAGVSDIKGGRKYARFRITNDPAIDATTPGGRAINGEVEDYPLDVPYAMSIGSYIWEDLDGQGDQDASEPKIQGATVHLLVEDTANPGSFVDATHLDGSSVTDITTGTDGKYFFSDLPEGKYKVQVTVADSYEPSPVQTGGNDDDSVGDSNINTAAAGLPANTYESGEFTLTAGTEPTEAGGLEGDDQDDANDANGNMTVDFGFVQPVSIGSVVWEDKDRDGLQGAAEPRIAGATVHLLVEDSANPGTYIAATHIGGGAITDITTDATGTYYFGNLPAGNYKVQVTPPAGYLPTALQTTSDDNGAAEDDSNIAANPAANVYESPVIALSPRTEKQEADTQDGDSADGTAGSTEDISGDMTVDFGFVKPVSIGSFVWEDKDRDGIQDNTEPKVQGATVHLLVDDGAGNFVAAKHVDGSAVADITTLADGKYLFDKLPEGDYRVQVTAPAGFSKTPVQTTADNDDTENDSNIASTAGNVHTSGTFILTAGGEPQEADTQEGDDSDGASGSIADLAGNMTVDFGLVQSVSIGSVVWDDNNKDGDQDAAEPKIEGALVHLLIEDPANPGTFIAATHEDGSAVADITTDATGEYLFDTLPEGKYKVQVTPPATYEPSPVQTTTETDAEDDSNIASSPSTGVYESAVFTLSAGTEPAEADTFAGDAQDGASGGQSDTSGNMTIDFGFILKPVSIGSYVWDDKDKDGMQGASEPALAGATVHLLVEDPANPGTFVDAVDTTGATVADIVTVADGKYFFDSLPEGKYKVQVTPPAGYEPSPVQTTTATNAESDSNIATSPSAGLYESAVFTLTAGTAPTEAGTQAGDDADDADETSGNMTVDFGFYSPVSIGSTVWFDSNNNGQMDGSENGIAGVTVVLLDDAGQVVDSNLTDSNGNYFFGDLAEGNYTVTIPVPPLNAPRSSDTTNTNDDGTDNDDNGQQAATGGAVTSALIELTRTNENHTETGSGSDLDSANDANGDMTVDFGFYNPVSVGSTVWFDSNNNGQIDNNESGIAGVTVVLLDDLGNPVDTNVTDSDGNYFFKNLTEGNYTVTIPAPPANAPLSSTATDSNDNSEDNDDNGIQASIGTAVTSPVIELMAGTENNTTEDANHGGDMDDSLDRNGDMTVDFGFFDPVSIGSTLYYDEDNNGMQEGTETGIPGIEVQIFKAGDDPLTATPVDTNITDVNGDYLFEGLTEGQYFIYIPTAPQDAPLSSTVTVTTDNDVDGDDNGMQDEYNSSIRSPIIDLSVNGEVDDSVETAQGATLDNGDDDNGNMTVDFGFIPQSQLASIGDTVWIDSNKNGMQDEVDAGLEYIQVILYDDMNNTIATTITDENGTYGFSNLPSGDYYVEFNLTSLEEEYNDIYRVTDENVTGSSDANNSDANSVSGKTPLTHLDPGENDPSWDMGVYPLGSLSGNVSHELHDGTLIPLEGVVITLHHPDGTPVLDGNGQPLTATTDADGNYEFTDLEPGEYIVREEQPNGFFDVREKEGGFDDDNTTATGVNEISATVGAGENDVNNDFVEAQAASLGDLVWYDNDQNGIHNTDEDGVENVRVYLLDANGDRIQDNNGNDIFTETNTTGEYIFEGLNPLEEYAVEFDLGTLPERFIVTEQDMGAEEADDSDADPDTGMTAPVSLNAGEHYADLDMGIYAPTAHIGDYFWIDSNQNGIQDPGEEPVAGATVELFDENGDAVEDVNGNHQIATDENGRYGFDVIPGTYQVRFTIPEEGYEGYIFSAENQGDDASDTDVNDRGFTQTISVEAGQNVLTLDAGINCGCENAPIKSNGGDALGVFGILSIIFMTLMTALLFVRKEEEQSN